jgi:hypothetical protein
MKRALKKKPAKRKAVLQCSKAYKEAVEEIRQEHVEEIKTMVRGTLKAIADAEMKAREARDELAFLRMDLEDLKRGRLEAIKKRHESRYAKGAHVSDTPINPRRLGDLIGRINVEHGQWAAPAWTSGYVTTTTNATDTALIPSNAAFVSSVVADEMRSQASN